MQTIDLSQCVFPTTTFEERSFTSRDTRVFSPGERVCYRNTVVRPPMLFPADYLGSTEDTIQRHRLRIYFDNTVRIYPVLWYDVGKISARGVAELGKAFDLPREVDAIIYGQITGKERKQATPEERQKNLSKLSEKIDEELERQQMAKEDKPATTSNSNVNMGGRKSRKRNLSKRKKTLRRIK